MRHDPYEKLAKKLKSPLLGQVTISGNDTLSKLNKQDATPASKASMAVAIKNQASQAAQDGEKSHMNKLCKKMRRMTTHELETLLESDDNLIIDCLIDSNPTIRKLSEERDQLQREVSDLAKFNYAREPEFSRDRMKLRDILNNVIPLKQRVITGKANRLLDKISKAEKELSTETGKCEEASEDVANGFLEGKKDYDAFLEDYIKLRTVAHQKRILADNLIKYRSQLAQDLNPTRKPLTGLDPPTPPHRQRKRVSLNG